MIQSANLISLGVKKMTKYLLMNYAKQNLVGESIKNCLELFQKSSDKMMIIDSIGSYLTELLVAGKNLKIPAVEDNTYIKSMGQAFVIRYDESKVGLISLVNFILWLANEVSYSENPNQKLVETLQTYEVA